MQKTNIPSPYLEELYQPENIEHLIHAHILQEVTYDVENVDLDKKYTRLTQFAAAVADLMGRIIGSIDVRFRVPEHIVMAPQAALITQTFPDDIHYGADRDLPHIAAGKMAYFFETIYEHLWDALEDTSEEIEIIAKLKPIPALIADSNYEPRFEEIRTYSFIDKQGFKHDIRLHNKGKRLAYRVSDDNEPDPHLIYRDVDGKRWKKFSARALTSGFNNIRADDGWMMMTAFSSGMADIILSYLKENNLFRVDVSKIVKAAVALDIRGEEGVQAGTAISPGTGKSYKAFGLSALMKVNTRLPVPARGIRGGVLMPDGSLYDPRLGHQNALYDVLATIALKHYIRERDPELVARIERNSDLEKLKNFLIGDETFALRPLRAFLRDSFPDVPQVHVGVCVNINEQIKERPQAVLIRTDGDAMLADYTYKKKHLIDMDVDELVLMLGEQRGTADAICEIVDLRKSPAIFEGDIAFKRGRAHNPDRHELNRNFINENKELCERIIEAHAKGFVPFTGADDAINPRMEEEVFTNFQTLKQLEITMPDGQHKLMPDDVHYRAVLEKGRNIDYVLRTLLEPDPIEWIETFTPEKQADIIKNFSKKVRKAESDLEKYQGNGADALVLPEADAPYHLPRRLKKHSDEEWELLVEASKKNAVDYLWKLRASLMYAFHDYSLSYRVYDRDEQEVAFTALVNMPDHIRGNRLAADEYHVKFEQLNYSSEKVARLFWDNPERMDWVLGRLENNTGAQHEIEEWHQWQKYYNALAALHLNGPPHMDVDDHPWMSAKKSLKEIERIRHNFKTGHDIRQNEAEAGLWELFVADRPKAEAILDALEKHCRAMLKKYPFTAEARAIMGYDSKGWPVEYIKYQIANDAPVLMLDVPDTLLTKPINHIDIGGGLIPVVMPQMGIDIASVLELGGLSVVLRGQETGRVCLAANARIVSDITFDYRYTELYDLAHKNYVDSGMVSPDKEKLVWLKVECPPETTPIAIRQADTAKQLIRLTYTENFEGTVSRAFGLRSDYVTGFIIKDEGFTPVVGAARIAPPANDNRHMGWERETTIESVTSMTLKAFRDEIAKAVKRTKKGEPEETTLPALSHDIAIRCGFAGLEDMRSKITHLFTDQERSIDDPNSRLHIGLFAKVAKDTTTFFDPERRPVAGFVRPLSQAARKKLWGGVGKIINL